MSHILAINTYLNMKTVKKTCSLLTLAVFVLTQCLTPISYALAENDDASDFQIEENVVQDENVNEDAEISDNNIEEDIENTPTETDNEETDE